MTGPGRGLVWLVVLLAVVLAVVAAGGGVMVLRERERAATERRLAAAARQRLAAEQRKTAEAERRAAAAGGGGPVAAAGTGLAALRGRHAWVVTKSPPGKDYCAMLRGAGVVVRCAYGTNKVKLHVLILRCPMLTEAHGRALLAALGLNLPINNWQRENACGRHDEITIYLND